MPRENLIKLRKGTSAQWTESNPILENGEPGYDTTDNVLKIGNGSSAWSSLNFVANGSQIKRYNEVSSFPNPGSGDFLYISLNASRIYMWNGSAYIELGPG